MRRLVKCSQQMGRRFLMFFVFLHIGWYLDLPYGVVISHLTWNLVDQMYHIFCYLETVKAENRLKYVEQFGFLISRSGSPSQSPVADRGVHSRVDNVSFHALQVCDAQRRVRADRRSRVKKHTHRTRPRSRASAAMRPAA